MPQRRPVILVHGLLSTSSMLWPLKRRLERGGHQVFLTSVSPLAADDIRTLAAQLEVSVQSVRRLTNAPLVDLVGVSQGGLIALWWLHHLDGWPRVRRFVALGSPVRGTWAAALGAGLFGAFSQGVWQALPASNVVRDLATRPLPDDADVVTLSLEGDPVCPPERCQLDGARNIVIPGESSALAHQRMILDLPVATRILELLQG